MVDLVVVAANVQPAASSIIKTANAAVAITAGDSVFLDTAGDLDLCEKDQTVVEAACRGIALGDGAVGQPVSYVISGDVNMGVILAIGQVYIVGAGPGGIAPEADGAVGNFITVIGVATTTSNLKMAILQSGVAHA